MWNYQDLKEKETLAYITTILDQHLDYEVDKVVKLINYTHNFIREKIEKSAVSLRDVDRFKKLYLWFKENMP